jgi:hypothetical protein
LSGEAETPGACMTRSGALRLAVAQISYAGHGSEVLVILPMAKTTRYFKKEGILAFRYFVEANCGSD